MSVDIVFGWNNAFDDVCFIGFWLGTGCPIAMTLTNLWKLPAGRGTRRIFGFDGGPVPVSLSAVLWCPMASGTATSGRELQRMGKFAIYFTNVLAIFVPCRYNITYWTMNYISIYNYILLQLLYHMSCEIIYMSLHDAAWSSWLTEIIHDWSDSAEIHGFTV